jgi:hypothetical protein
MRLSIFGDRPNRLTGKSASIPGGTAQKPKTDPNRLGRARLHDCSDLALTTLIRPRGAARKVAGKAIDWRTIMDKSWQRVLRRNFYKATKEFIVIALYLWLIFGLFALYRSVILAENHVPAAEEGFALVNALVRGKVVLAGKGLHLGDLPKDAPLIYPTLVKSALFSLLLAVFKILEAAAIGVYRGKSFDESVGNLGGGTWQGILCLTFLLFVLLIPFFGFTELERGLGNGKLQELFFHPRQISSQPTEIAKS